MKKVLLSKVVSFLDKELALSEFPDDESQNGLQVEGRGAVKRIGIAVDACEEVFRKAAEKDIDFLFVHHGIIWGGIKSIRGVTRKRIQALFDAGISLYACHLPLDGHPVYGNNAQILKLLSLTKKGLFGLYHGRQIGCRGRTKKVLTVKQFRDQVDRSLMTRSTSIPFRKNVRNVGVVSGGGWFAIQEAEKYNIDTFLTGEPAHSAYTLAEEMKINLIFAGHYATEVPGIKAVGRLLNKKFGLVVDYIDHPTGL
jgi:dinuclear metal center YbgI/SA1388 family protein